MNAGLAHSEEPVENIVFQENAPLGKYQVFVNQYCHRTKDTVVPWEVHITIRGNKTIHKGNWSVGGEKMMPVDIFELTQLYPLHPVYPEKI